MRQLPDDDHQGERHDKACDKKLQNSLHGRAFHDGHNDVTRTAAYYQAGFDAGEGCPGCENNIQTD